MKTCDRFATVVTPSPYTVVVKLLLNEVVLLKYLRTDNLPLGWIEIRSAKPSVVKSAKPASLAPPSNLISNFGPGIPVDAFVTWMQAKSSANANVATSSNPSLFRSAALEYVALSHVVVQVVFVKPLVAFHDTKDIAVPAPVVLLS